MKKTDKQYYLNLPWTYTVETEEFKGKSYFIIRVNELPGICTDAEDLNTGMEEIREVISAAIEIYLEKGEPIPEPINREQFKGKIAYRTDSERHYKIVKAAKILHKSISETLDIFVDAEIKKILPHG